MDLGNIKIYKENLYVLIHIHSETYCKREDGFVYELCRSVCIRTVIPKEAASNAYILGLVLPYDHLHHNLVAGPFKFLHPRLNGVGQQFTHPLSQCIVVFDVREKLTQRIPHHSLYAAWSEPTVRVGIEPVRVFNPLATPLTQMSARVPRAEIRNIRMGVKVPLAVPL